MNQRRGNIGIGGAGCERRSRRWRLINCYGEFGVETKDDIQLRYGVARDLHALTNRGKADVFKAYPVRSRREVNRISPVIARPQIPIHSLASDDDVRVGDVDAARV